MAEFTREQQLQAVYDLKVGYTLGHADIAMLKSMARQLLAGMEQEPVAYMYRDNLHTDARFSLEKRLGNWSQEDINEYEITEIPLYAAPQLTQPAVLSASDGALKSLLPDAEKPEFWFEHNGKIFFEGVRFNNAVFEACRAAMLQGAEPVSQPYTLPTKCWCHTCRPVTMNDARFVVCPDCGNKRCPRANDHRNACTGSNEPGQEGSAYPAAPQQEADNG